MSVVSRSTEYELSEADFHRLRGRADHHAGIEISPAKRDLVYNRVSKRLRALGMSSFARYCDLLEAEHGDEVEQFVNAVTTNLTSFYREPHHFDFLREIVSGSSPTPIPGHRVRVWSAGCSTGEEAYSIAISLAEAIPGWQSRDVRVLATDIDSRVLATGAAGRYTHAQIKALTPGRQNWFRADEGNGAVVDGNLQQMVAFRQLNLTAPWPMKGPFDAIFCRNVVIYFSQARQRALFERFADLLTPDGHLFLGHSESLLKMSTRFRLIGRSIYQRTA